MPPSHVSMEIADRLRLLNKMLMLIKSQASRAATQPSIEFLTTLVEVSRRPDIRDAEELGPFTHRRTQFSEQKEVTLA